ncbi:Flp family type IVb pilin [Sphingomonas aracearum]|uniref:Flp family type IVb pilin n=1 Tax=Sphingomonas aracearum TaxID=2283317 RepID=UPI001EF1565B|nr:Flp family type IVb pilin [Sphingomonas aracearum]
MTERLVRCRRGGTAIEYGLIAALVTITMIATFIEVARTTSGMWNNTQARIEDARQGR